MKHYLLKRRCKETFHMVYIYEELNHKQFRSKLNEGWRRV